MKYEVNEGTLAILPEKNNASKILEDKKEYIVEESPFSIMDHSCKYFGSSYEGRKAGTKSMIGINYKVPIIIEDSRGIIFFPTSSPQEDDCMWLSIKRIKSYEKCDYNSTKVIFDNDLELEIPISYRSIENQILRANRLESVLEKRKG